jgi:hypothetical protein
MQFKLVEVAKLLQHRSFGEKERMQVEEINGEF